MIKHFFSIFFQQGEIEQRNMRETKKVKKRNTDIGERRERNKNKRLTIIFFSHIVSQI